MFCTCCVKARGCIRKISATCVKIMFKIYQSCMDVRKQYALGTVGQRKLMQRTEQGLSKILPK